MTAFLLITFFVLLAGTTTMSFYADVVPLLGALTKVFIGITVVEGVIMAVFVGLEIYNKIKKK